MITNIGESHLAFLLDTKGVAREKSGLFAGMDQGSKVVIPESILHLDIVEKEAEKAGVELIKTVQISVEPKKNRQRESQNDLQFQRHV